LKKPCFSSKIEVIPGNGIIKSPEQAHFLATFSSGFEQYDGSGWGGTELYHNLNFVAIPKLDRAMIQLGDLLSEPSLFAQITENDYQDFRELVEIAYKHTAERAQMTAMMARLDEKITIIEDLINRIKKEMPNIDVKTK
jgi:hypothetical protein